MTFVLLCNFVWCFSNMIKKCKLIVFTWIVYFVYMNSLMLQYKDKLIPNMNIFKEEFGAISVTGAKGWSDQQWEVGLDSRVVGENVDKYDYVNIDMSVTVVELHKKVGCSR